MQHLPLRKKRKYGCTAVDHVVEKWPADKRRDSSRKRRNTYGKRTLYTPLNSQLQVCNTSKEGALKRRCYRKKAATGRKRVEIPCETKHVIALDRRYSLACHSQVWGWLVVVLKRRLWYYRIAFTGATDCTAYYRGGF